MKMRLKIGQWLHAHTGTLSVNFHGPDFTPKRNTWNIVRMGSYAKTWTLYIYRSDGRAHQLMVAFPRWRGPWPEDAGSEPRP